MREREWKDRKLEEALYTKCPLRFGEDGTFRILMMSDIHGGKGYARAKTMHSIQALIEKANPDFVMLGGDIAGPGTIHVETEEDLRSLLDDISAPMEKAGIPWAHVFGNHDDNFGVSNEQQQAVYETYPHCVSKAGPEEISGVGNYVLPVWDRSGKRILCNLFGLDSHREMEDFAKQYGLNSDTVYLGPDGPVHSPDGVRFDQIKWYWETSKALEEYTGSRIPALMFFHIPLQEHKLVAANRELCDFTGNQLEEVECTPINNGLFAACLQRGDVKGIFCGHDHENDFAGRYCGITLGYDGYISFHACHDERTRGGRVIEISEEDPGNFITYMLHV